MEIVYYEFPQAVVKTDKGWQVDCVGFGTKRRVNCKQIIDCTGGAEVVGMVGLPRLREDERQPGSYLFMLGSAHEPGRNQTHRLYIHGADSTNSRTVTQANLTGRKTIFEKARKDGKRLMHLQPETGYHIKTLLAPGDEAQTPYWAFKHAGWEQAKREAEELEEVDAITSSTPNASFDPADYILPQATEDSTPYRLLLEINQPGDDQASLAYLVEINNALPRTFQLLDLHGYPKFEEDGDWDLYYIDESYTTALDLIDSALLTIERGRE